KSLKSSPPITLPIGGMMISLTSDVTTAPKAAPMMTPTARSRTLPRIANSLNSLNMVSPANDLWNSVLCLQKFEQRFIKHVGRFEVRNVTDAGQQHEFNLRNRVAHAFGQLRKVSAVFIAAKFQRGNFDMSPIIDNRIFVDHLLCERANHRGLRPI